MSSTFNEFRRASRRQRVPAKEDDVRRHTQTGLQTRIDSRCFVVAVLALVCLATASFSEEVRLYWDPSGDGRVDGYRVHFGEASMNYQWSVDVGNQTDATISGLQPGVTYYFACAAYDLDSGLVSGFSNEVHASIPEDPAVPPTANFQANPTMGTAPLVVDFVDTSSGDVNAWSWDFGDGGASIAEYPTHTYESEGLYTVTLTVAGPAGADSKTVVDLVNVTTQPATEPSITAPTPGSRLPRSKVTFRWTSNGIDVQRWRLDIGSALGGGDLLATGNLSKSRLQLRARRLPTDGRSVFVRLWFKTNNVWRFVDFLYQAADR